LKEELESIRTLHDTRIHVLEAQISRRDRELEAQREQISSLLREAQRHKDEVERLRSSIRQRNKSELVSQAIQSRVEETVQRVLPARTNSSTSKASAGSGEKPRLFLKPKKPELAFRPLRQEIEFEK
jgi:regulator of replication initiation timing